MFPIPSPSDRDARVWIPTLVYLLLVSGPLMWAMSQLINNSSKPLWTDAEMQATAQYLWDNPQTTSEFVSLKVNPDTKQLCIIQMYDYVPSRVKIEINNHVVFQGSTEKSWPYVRDALGPMPYACFAPPTANALYLIRITLFESPHSPLSDLAVYEWAFKPDTNE